MATTFITLPEGSIIQRENTVFHKDVIKLFTPGQQIVAKVHGNIINIEFLKHKWSGVVEITVGSRVEKVDLYSETPEKIKHEIRHDSKEATLQIKLLNSVALNSKHIANEVWIGSITSKDSDGDQEVIVTPVSEFLSLVEGKYGKFIVLNTDDGISRTILQTGMWAGKDVQLFEKYIKDGMNVCDIGANIGHHTVVFSKLVGQNGRVHAFEPQDHIYKILSANLVINNCLNTTAHRLAVGSEQSTLKMWPVDYTKQDNFGALGISQVEGKPVTNHDGEEVDVVKGDQFLKKIFKNGAPIHFIKIDVQTFELYVLQGMVDILREMKPILFLEISPFWMQKTGYDYANIYTLLYEAGYDIFMPHVSLEKPVEGITPWSGEQNEEWDILALPKK